MFNQDFTNWSSNWASLNKTFSEPMIEMQKLTMPFYEKISAEMIAAGSDNVATMMKYIHSLNKSTKVEDYAQAQINVMSELAEKNLQHGQKLFKINEQTLEDCRQAMLKKMSQVAEHGLGQGLSSAGTAGAGKSKKGHEED